MRYTTQIYILTTVFLLSLSALYIFHDLTWRGVGEEIPLITTSKPPTVPKRRFDPKFVFDNQLGPTKEQLRQQEIPKVDPRLEKAYIFSHDKGIIEKNTPVVYTTAVKGIHFDRRKLLGLNLVSKSNYLVKPAIIPLGNNQTETQRHYAYRYIFTRLKKYQSEFVVYPYPVTYTKPDTEEEFEYPQGAIFSTRPNSVVNNYKHIKTNSTINFGRAQALYDVSVAVLKVERTFEGSLKDLTYESDYFCSVLATWLGKFTQCLNADDYKKHYMDSAQSSFVYLSEKEIKEGLLMIDSTTPRFGTFIIPDIILGSETLLKNALGNDGLDKIKAYVAAGGVLYVSGKGGMLLEELGIMTKGTFNTDYLLYSTTTVAETTGCETPGDPYSTDYTDFIKRMLCFSVVTNSKSKAIQTYILSPYLMKGYGGMSHIASFKWTENLEKKDSKTGLSSPLTDAEKRMLPMVLYKTHGKGHVVLNQANPIFVIEYFPWFLNSVLLSMSRNFIMDARVAFGDEEKPIPGLEEGIVLDLQLDFLNLFNTPLKDFYASLWLPNNVATMEISPANACVLDNVLPPPKGREKELNTTAYWKCKFSEIDGLTRVTLKLTVEILDARVTQRRNNILMLYPYIEYTDGRTGKHEQYDHGGVFVNAQLAALLRGSINPDPSSFYPIAGRGQYVDNVVPAENKEHTQAFDVEFIGIVPIISPVVDISDQLSAIETIEFWDGYYKKDTNLRDNYPYPFRNLRDFDYLDYNFLKGRGVVLAADWDTPVKNFKIVMNASDPNSGYRNISIDVKNINYTTNNDNELVLTQQVHFADSDKFFEHATQRTLVFVDTSTPEGAASYYPNGIPADVRNPNSDPSRPTVKKEFMWVRTDVYFYETAEYTRPENVNYTHVFSIDRYRNEYTGPCVPKLGDAKAKIMVKGYFDDTKPRGLKPNEYSNELLMHCEKQKIDYSKAEEFTGGSVKPARYLVPIKDKTIQHASDLRHFDEVTGELKDYPEVKFVRAHYMFIHLDPNISRKGGYLEFVLPQGYGFENDVDPVKENLVTYSADHVAFYKTTYTKRSNGNIIRSYFKRGNMPDEQYGKPSQIGINIERLTPQTEMEVTLNIYELKYDLSSEQTGYERYLYREQRTVEVIVERFFSLPALELRFKLRRGDPPHTILQPYEYLEPFVRFGVYYQELQGHRTIWGSAETHHVSDPGLTSKSGGFSVLSNIGISSVPFREYVTTGESLMIPSASQTSRLEWSDIWGRRWVQPIRSVFPDVPPIPPPLRNFMMSTTFEITDPDTGERYLEWPSDIPVDVRVHIKLLNNYPKYFQITTCKENEINFIGKAYPSRIFSTPPLEKQITTWNEDDYVGLGNLASYGMCFTEDRTIIAGKPLSAYQRDLIANAHLCAAHLMTSLNCSEALKDIPTVCRRKGNDTSIKWNYSPLVEQYYPETYIRENMWDLTHYDYDDNAFDKAYKYHMDNNLPSLDKNLRKPHNTIAQPIWKGFGFEIVYDKTYSVKRFPDRKGWWSDNLQNKDDTLLAGQEKSNFISVDKEPLLKPEDWIQITDLKNISKKELDSALSNIYVCLFNRHRPKVRPDNKKVRYLDNVYQNNVVPIIPSLSSNDRRLTQYNCDLTKEFQYNEYNISQLDATLVTNSARDWLYFAANLRGGAKETINVVYKMIPFSDVNHEGQTKVNDGARFVYWNPANGPNSYLIVDNVVNVVDAKRSDIVTEVEMFPKLTTTFKSVIYQLITVQDPPEIERRYTSPIYINHYGFGDTTTSVYVGGTRGSTAILQPGQSTYAKITLFNNCGFDWNMKGEAIEFNYTGSKPISANDLLTRYKHAIQVPLKYNFLRLEIPEEIRPYVTIYPSDHNVDVAPLFFDFQNINVVTIRDGYKGDYFYKIDLAPDVPEELRGRLWNIKVHIVEKHFDKLPNYNSPVKPGYHDYHVQIPDIVFGIPFSANMGKYAGKVYYTSGFSTNLRYTHPVPDSFEPWEAKFITKEQIMKMRSICAEPKNLVARMEEFFKTLGPEVQYSKPDPVNGVRELQFDLTGSFPVFPLPQQLAPAQAEFYILLKTTAEELPYGTNNIAVINPKITYVDHAKKPREAIPPPPEYRTVSAKGAWLTVSYDGQLVDEETLEPKKDQRFFPDDTGYVETVVKVVNVGTDIAYNVDFKIQLAPAIEIDTSKIKCKYEIIQSPNITAQGHTLHLYTGIELAPHIPHAEKIYIKFVPTAELDEAFKQIKTAQLSNPGLFTEPIHKERVFIEYVSAAIDITPTPGEIRVEKRLDRSYSVEYILRERERVSIYGSQELDENELPVIKLRAKAFPNVTQKGFPVKFIFYKRVRSPVIYSGTYINGTYVNGTFINGTYVNTTFAWVKFNETYSPIVYDRTVPPRDENYTVWLVDYRVETVDENGQFLAISKKLAFQYKYPIYYYWLIPLVLVPIVVGCILGILLYVFYQQRDREMAQTRASYRRSIAPSEPRTRRWYAEHEVMGVPLNTPHDRGHLIKWIKAEEVESIQLREANEGVIEQQPAIVQEKDNVQVSWGSENV